MSYQDFLKALEGPFEEFVRSDKVNAYLQTIGPAVKTEIIQNGIPTEFVVVSGYEEARGRWCTAYNHRIRFGDEIFPAGLIPHTMVITPNFFYGKNRQGQDVEYRMGLVRTEDHVKVLPVLLKRSKNRIGHIFVDQIEATVLDDLCVIHKGIFIDAENAAQLGAVEINNLTSYQQFLATFWNIDDYIRKQNPNFYSDFDIEIWTAVEAFSGRIVTQMLRMICSLTLRYGLLSDNDPIQNNELEDFMIDETIELYKKDTIAWIEKCIDEDSKISPAQTMIFVKNLCSIVTKFGYDAFNELHKKGIDIIPYIFQLMNDSEEEVRQESIDAFSGLIERFPEYAKFGISPILDKILQGASPEKNILMAYITILRIAPQLITREHLKKIFRNLEHSDVKLRSTAIEFYTTTMELIPDLILLEHFNQIYENLYHAERRIIMRALDACKFSLEHHPEFFTQIHIDKLLEFLYNDDTHFVREIINLYSLAISKTPHLITQSALNKILQLISNDDPMIRFAVLQAYESALSMTPVLINPSDFTQIVDLLADRYDYVRERALAVFSTIINKYPNHIAPNMVPKIVDRLIDFSSNPDEDIRKIAENIIKLMK